MEKMLSIEEVAEALQVPVATVYRWNTRAEGPLGIRVGRYVRYRASDVEAWLTSRQATDRRAVDRRP